MHCVNDCDHDWMKVVSAYFMTNMNCYTDFYWCKRCGELKSVKTYDESIIDKWTPESVRKGDFLNQLLGITKVAEYMEKKYTEDLEKMRDPSELRCKCLNKPIEIEDSYDYYDGPDTHKGHDS